MFGLNIVIHLFWIFWSQTTEQDRTAILGGIPRIFRLYSAYGTPSFLYTQAWYPIRHFSALMFTNFVHFPPIFTHFLLIFRLNGTPSLLYTQAWYPMCFYYRPFFTCFIYGFRLFLPIFSSFSADFLPNPFSAGPVLPGSNK